MNRSLATQLATLAFLLALALNIGAFAEELAPLHIRPEKGAFADAIPFFHDGVYHVFYLHAGNGPGTTWDHITSTDLIHWKELGVALPRGKSDEPDGDSVFTGSVFEAKGTFHIFYTGWNPKLPLREQIMHAISPDLEHWTKHPSDTFHADGKIYQNDGGKDFRDPFIIEDPKTQHYHMFLYARRVSDGRGCVGHYTSPDLTTWIAAEPLDCAMAGECPDLFAINDRWYYLTSRGGMWWASSDQFLGHYQSPKVAHLDTPLAYAVKRTFDGRRHIAFGFIRDFKDNTDLGMSLWGGNMLLPREVYRGAGGQLAVRPASEIINAYTQKVLSLADKPSFDVRIGAWAYGPTGLVGKNNPTMLTFKSPANYYLHLEAKPSPIGRLIVRMRDQGPHGLAYALVVDMQHQLTEFRGPLTEFSRATAISHEQPVVIDAFLDANIIECFINNEYAFTQRAYDFPGGDLSIGGDDAGVTITKMELKIRQ